MDYESIIAAVKKAGELATNRDPFEHVSSKTESDFVTQIDLDISAFLKRELHSLTPDIGFMSEEEESEIEPVRWILDPIDGTTNLLYGYNMSSVSLGLCDHETIVFGVVYNPFTNEIFTAERGKGAYYNGKRLKPLEDRDLKLCLIEFGAGVSRKKDIETSFAIAKEVFASCLDLRRVCSSALALCYIAAGKLNGYFEPALKPWDFAAASLILEECGGKNVTWEGTPVPYDKPTSYIAGTNKAVDFLLKTIQKHVNH